MFTRPTDIEDADVAGLVARRWGLDVTTLAYRPVGFGSHHWVATTPSGSWFVTVDDLVVKRHDADEPLGAARARLVAALTTARALRDAGFDFVVAPVPSDDGEVVEPLGERYVVAVYPTVAGTTFGYGNYDDASHRDEVVGHLAAMHQAPAACRRFAGTHDLRITRRADYEDACTHLGEHWDAGPFAEPTRRLLERHVDAVTALFATYDVLADRARARADRFVLTHGEPHPANTIRTPDGVVLVDWDTALIAPPERDLWDIAGEDPSVVGRYEQLTGSTVDPDAIELYRLAWDLTEIAIYVSDLYCPHDRTTDTETAWHNLQQYLDPSRWTLG